MLLEKLTAAFKKEFEAFKGSLHLSGDETLKGRITELEGKLKAAEDHAKELTEGMTSGGEKIKVLIFELAQAKEEVALKDKEIAELKAKEKSLGQRAIDLVAGQGVPVNQLPAGTVASGAGLALDAELAKVQEEARAERDAGKRAELIKKERELWWKIHQQQG